MSTSTIPRAALEWIVGRDTGLSSETIWAVMCGVGHAKRWPSTPSDVSDFGRCHRLLELVPEWRVRLGEVAEAFPEWAVLVANWDRLTSLYLEEPPAHPKLYAEMKRLLDQPPMRARTEATP